MGKARKRRERAEAREHARQQMEGYGTVLDRCGESWGRAYQELRAEDVSFSEFANDKFDCRECPLYAECLTKNHFTNNTKWFFSWFESEFEQFETGQATPEKGTD